MLEPSKVPTHEKNINEIYLTNKILKLKEIIRPIQAMQTIITNSLNDTPHTLPIEDIYRCSGELLQRLSLAHHQFYIPY